MQRYLWYLLFVMKQYLIDGLSPKDHERLKNYLDEYHGPCDLGTIYWVELDRELLTPLQKEHTLCGPHYFALELGRNFLSCELLVRIRRNIKCDCMGYATARQREWLICMIDSLLDKLDITI